MDVAIKKVGKRDGKEWFVLVSTRTREIITIKDVTENAIRRFFQERGVSEDAINKCLESARRRYADAAPKQPANESADTMGEDDLLFQLGLDEDSDVH